MTIIDWFWAACEEEGIPLMVFVPGQAPAIGPIAARRMLWGTDYSRLPCPDPGAVRLFTEALDFPSARDREWIIGRAAAEWLRWPP